MAKKVREPEAAKIVVEETTAPGHVPQMDTPIVAAIAAPSEPPALPAEPPPIPPELVAAAGPEAKEREIAALRVQLAEALKRADEQLGAANKRFIEAEDLRRRSLPPSPTEANEARIRAARLSAELAEVRADRDEQKRAVDNLSGEAASLRDQLATLQTALEVREARATLAENQVQEATAKVAEAEARVQSARDESTRTIDEQRGALDVAHREIDGMKAALARAKEESGAATRGLGERVAALEEEEELLRQGAERAASELESTRVKALAREQQIVSEVREREARMVAEVQAREAQLIAAAQTREAQLLADAKSAMEDGTQAQLKQVEQIARLQVALDEAREREASLDAELRLLRGRVVDDDAELSEQVEHARREARHAKDEMETLQESVGRAEARAAELLSTVDSLGRERAALRAEAGKLRAQVELLQTSEQRLQQLASELEELRGENDFLNQEVARYASAPAPRASAPPPLPGKT